MKQVGFLFLLLLGLAFSACNNDVCQDAICGPNSTCVQGTCECQDGYSEDDRGLCVLSLSLEREKFVGFWEVIGGCFIGTSFERPIYVHPTEEDKLILNTLYYLNRDAVAVMTSPNSFKIPLQEYGSASVIEGSGTLSSSTQLDIEFTVTDEDGDLIQQCTVIYML